MTGQVIIFRERTDARVAGELFVRPGGLVPHEQLARHAGVRPLPEDDHLAGHGIRDRV